MSTLEGLETLQTLLTDELILYSCYCPALAILSYFLIWLA